MPATFPRPRPRPSHPDCETIVMQDIGAAYARMDTSDFKCRFMIDMASLAL